MDSRGPVTNLRAKARSALAAARALASEHPDSSASRAYYAAHQALRWKLGTDLPRGHSSAWSNEVMDACGLTGQEGESVRRLYELRKRADYSDDRGDNH